jgi:hypothetical protein
MVPCIVFSLSLSLSLSLYIYIYIYIYTHTHRHTKNVRDATLVSWFYYKNTTCFGYFPYPPSWVKQLQLTATGTTYVKLGREQCGKVRLQNVHDRAVGHITQLTTQRNVCCTSGCTPDNGYGKYTKRVECSCIKIKILVLHLSGHFVCIYLLVL